MNSPVRLGVFPATPTPTGFIARGFEALFPQAGTLGCAVHLAPQLFLPVYPHANVGPPTPLAAALPNPGLPATALLCILFTQAAHLGPSYQSGWMFLLQLLGFQTSIQFDFLGVLDFFVFNFVVLLLLVLVGKVYLPTPLSWLDNPVSFFKEIEQRKLSDLYGIMKTQ